MLFCRISWMREYEGLAGDVFVPAGRFPKENGYGGECWNFKPYDGRMYGYARAHRGNPQSVIRHLGGGGPILDGVTVVWVATPGRLRESRIVGWYKGAKLLSDYRSRPDAVHLSSSQAKAKASGGQVLPSDEEFAYFAVCREDDAFLLDVTDRKFRMPIGKGWMGSSSFLFYADGGGQHDEFKDRVADYIDAWPKSDEMLPSELIDDPDTTWEGEQVISTHRVRERDRRSVERAKARFKGKHGRLFCEACGLDFREAYGSLGEGYIEAHHIRPLKEGVRRTRVKDFMMLCANCHRMAHRLIAKKGGHLAKAKTKRGLSGGRHDA